MKILRALVETEVPEDNPNRQDLIKVINELEDVSKLKERIRELEKINSDMGWQLNPDRMGR